MFPDIVGVERTPVRCHTTLTAQPRSQVTALANLMILGSKRPTRFGIIFFPSIQFLAAGTARNSPFHGPKRARAGEVVSASRIR